jgi:hypothetical protein
MKNFTTSLNDKQLADKLKNLKKDNDSFSITTSYSFGDYYTIITLEKIDNPDQEFQIWVGLTGGFTHDEEGHKKIIEYCNY